MKKSNSKEENYNMEIAGQSFHNVEQQEIGNEYLSLLKPPASVPKERSIIYARDVQKHFCL